MRIGWKKEVETKQKSINTLTDAIKAIKARKQLSSLAIEKANNTANQPPKRKPGRPRKSQ